MYAYITPEPVSEFPLQALLYPKPHTGTRKCLGGAVEVLILVLTGLVGFRVQEVWGVRGRAGENQ